MTTHRPLQSTSKPLKVSKWRWQHQMQQQQQQRLETRHVSSLVFDTGRQNPPGTRIWISRVRIPMTFLVSAALPVPLSIKPVPATAGFDYKSCVGDCWSNSTSSISRYVVLVSNSSHAIVLVKYIPISMDQVSVSIPGQNPSKSVPVVWGTGFDGYGYRWLKFYPRVTRVKHYLHQENGNLLFGTLRHLLMLSNALGGFFYLHLLLKNSKSSYK